MMKKENKFQKKNQPKKNGTVPASGTVTNTAVTDGIKKAETSNEEKAVLAEQIKQKEIEERANKLEERKKIIEDRRKELDEKRKQIQEEKLAKKNGTVSASTAVTNTTAVDEIKKTEISKEEKAVAAEQLKQKQIEEKSKTIEERKKIIEDRRKELDDKRKKILEEREAAKALKEKKQPD